jgi:hypothetical protein
MKTLIFKESKISTILMTALAMLALILAEGATQASAGSFFSEPDMPECLYNRD